MNETIVTFRFKNVDYSTPEAKQQLIGLVDESTLYVTTVDESPGFITIVFSVY